MVVCIYLCKLCVHVYIAWLGVCVCACVCVCVYVCVCVCVCITYLQSLDTPYWL